MKVNKSIPIILLFLAMGLAILLNTSGCTLIDLFGSSYSDGSALKLRDVDIDEKEVESIKALSSSMEKSYDISQKISSIADQLDNPFKPFYIEEDTGIEKNIIILQDIYSEDDTEYCEIKFNDFTYILTLEDTFNNTYLVQAINDSSVILLKGDEIMTLFIGEMIKD